MEPPPRPVQIAGRVCLLAFTGLLVLLLFKVLVIIALLAGLGYLTWCLIRLLCGQGLPPWEGLPKRAVNGVVSTCGRVRDEIRHWWHDAWRFTSRERSLPVVSAASGAVLSDLACRKGKLIAMMALEVVSGAVVGVLFVATARLQHAAPLHHGELALGALAGAILGGLVGKGRLHAALRRQQCS